MTKQYTLLIKTLIYVERNLLKAHHLVETMNAGWLPGKTDMCRGGDFRSAYQGWVRIWLDTPQHFKALLRRLLLGSYLKACQYLYTFRHGNNKRPIS